VRGRIGSTYAGPQSVACAENFEREHQLIMVEIGDAKE